MGGGVHIPAVRRGLMAHLTVRATDPRRGARRALVAGCIVGVAAVCGPADGIADRLFAAHMVQHEMLIAVAAPLVAWGRPVLTMVRVSRAARRGAVALGTWHAGAAAVRVLRYPSIAFLLHAAAVWLWHVPAAFDAALAHPALHALQHASFFGTGILFWSAMMHPRRPADLGRSIVYLFVTAVHTAILGALLATALSPWYSAYASGAGSGLTPLEDQQLAGLVMWVPAGFLYLIAALHTARRWLDAAEWLVRQRTRGRDAAVGA
jgi:putative membrane protein